MEGMSESDAQALADRLTVVFPEAAISLDSVNPAASPGRRLYRVDVFTTTGRFLAIFYDLAFANRVIGRTLEPKVVSSPSRFGR